MVLSLDPEFAKAIEHLFPAQGHSPKIPIGDVASRRAGLDSVMGDLFAQYPDRPDVHEEIFHVRSTDGYNVPIHRFIRKDSTATTRNPAIVYLHGGGYICMDVPFYRPIIRNLVSLSGVQIFAVDYRLAPEVHFPTPFEDAWIGLKDVSENATKYNVDSARIAVMGDSAGGGLAASLALKARDESLSPPLAKQILIYAMMDDRTTTPNEALEPFSFTWGYEDNITGWQAYLGDKVNGKVDGVISYYAAAARAGTVAGLPSTYVDTGELDIYRDENAEYVRRLLAAGISTEFHIYPGLPHGFELFACKISSTAAALANRVRAMTSF